MNRATTALAILLLVTGMFATGTATLRLPWGGSFVDRPHWHSGSS